MRKVSYKLANGTVTTSYTMAKESGQPFTTSLDEVGSPRVEMTAERKQKIEEYFRSKRK